MCGIHATISSSPGTPLTNEFKRTLSNRGPDHFGQATRSLKLGRDGSHDAWLTFTSTVLALRGDHVAIQPLEHLATESVLCWNGEAWKIAGEVVTGNDGETILARLTSIPPGETVSRQAHILRVLRDIEGPFAFLFYDAPGKELYFGRDRLGRRSLLVNEATGSPSLTFSSVAEVPTAEWKEVSADGFYSLDLSLLESLGSLDYSSQIKTHQWVPAGAADWVSGLGSFNMARPAAGHKLDFSSPSVQLLRHYLTEALKLRVLNIPEPPSTQQAADVHDIRVAILFSGGLDCSLLARITHELLPPTQGIDLINVAFENPREAAKLQGRSVNQPLPTFTTNLYEKCPDRITGRKAFDELRGTCPDRYWRFITVDVPFEEAMAHKTKIVSLIFPHDTEMDLSIAFALYFAARGIGAGYFQGQDPNGDPPIVTTPARVLLSGLGADELFGGYMRHATAFERQGYPGLIDELKLDVSRIGQRNLGRDDRVMSHWGKEVRFPFLDEDLVKFAMALPVEEKCDFENKFHPAVIEPAKRVLRFMADQLGLPSIAREKKRAIQFGSRTAKMESQTGRIRGTAQISAAIPSNQ